MGQGGYTPFMLGGTTTAAAAAMRRLAKTKDIVERTLRVARERRAKRDAVGIVRLPFTA